MTLSSCEWPFYVKIRFVFCQLEFKISLFLLTWKALLSILGIDNICLVKVTRISRKCVLCSVLV